MKNRMPSTQKHIGTHPGYGATKTNPDAAPELNARIAAQNKAADMKAANPEGWKGWKVQDIARTVNNFTLDEDGFAWA